MIVSSLLEEHEAAVTILTTEFTPVFLTTSLVVKALETVSKDQLPFSFFQKKKIKKILLVKWMSEKCCYYVCVKGCRYFLLVYAVLVFFCDFTYELLTS